jgi:hypothetical protein
LRFAAAVNAVAIRAGVAGGVGFAPSLNLVPGTLAQSRHRLWLRVRAIDRRKSRRTEQRVHQRVVFGAQARDFGFQQADVAALQQFSQELSHVMQLR